MAGTIEVDPGYGKYHFTGHRNCNIVMNPADAEKIHNICPVCKSKMTIGVSARVEELADRPEGNYDDVQESYSIMPLTELISGYYKYPLASKKALKTYNDLIARFHNEFNILLNADLGELKKVVDEIRKLTKLPIIYDHQKAGTDIPDTGDGFMKACKDSGVDARKQT